MHSRSAMAWGILLFGFPLFFWRKQCHCFECGADFPAQGQPMPERMEQLSE